jgi:hypothetical protein
MIDCDPILAAIEEYKRADKVCFDSQMESETSPQVWWEQNPEINQAYENAMDALANTRPTTVATLLPWWR